MLNFPLFRLFLGQNHPFYAFFRKKTFFHSLSLSLSLRAAIRCLGSMYEKLGRMMGRSYEETVQILLKSLKSAESQMRIEIMVTLEKVCNGMDTAISNVHKEIYKATKYCLTDRVMAVRVAAAKCLLEMMNHATFIYTTGIGKYGCTVLPFI